MMARILLNVFQNVGMRLVTVNGGDKDNVIANFSEASMIVLPECVEQTKKIINDTFEQIKDEYHLTDPNITIRINELDTQMLEAFSGPATLATIVTMVNLPNGVIRMNPEIKGLVQTSLNFGILRTKDDVVTLSYLVRSSKVSEKQYIIEKLKSLTEIFGGEVTVSGVYPGWDYKEDSKLREVMVSAYEDIYGKKPVVEGIHAGLECGIFAEKLQGLDAVSFGPQMNDIHTPDEELSISSTERTWNLLIETLKKLK
jgi:dipeptidase D